ncbi:MAG: hypothetical protein JO041_11600 [Acidobacteria bacterium]|nr:hypothetical protein [Acidobacteriota bacterium]
MSRLLAAAIVGATLLGGMATPAHAERHCERQVRKAETNYQRAVRRHGQRSRQAEQAHRRLEEARRGCR